jgi:hypothetical protein
MANKWAVAGENSRFKQPEAKPAGFWAGFWHGNIAAITFVVSLFNKDVGIYETHNNGGWYNFGFLLGVSSLFGSNVNVKVDESKKAEEEAPQAAIELMNEA